MTAPARSFDAQATLRIPQGDALGMGIGVAIQDSRGSVRSQQLRRPNDDGAVRLVARLPRLGLCMRVASAMKCCSRSLRARAVRDAPARHRHSRPVL
jgi:hypothetical protein